jgi:GT2 family glycosyltransferase
LVPDDPLVTGGGPGPPGAVVSGQYESTEPEEPGAFAPSTTPSGDSRRVFREPGSVDVLYTGNAAIRRSTLRSVGGFDPRLGPGTRYPAAEDNDLAHRLLTSGVSVVFDPAARVLHRAWRPASDLAPLRWRYGRGQGAFLAKHLTDPAGATRRRLAGEIVRRARRIGQAAIRRRTPVGPEVAYLAGLLSGAAEWIVRERVVDGAPAGQAGADAGDDGQRPAR